MKFLILLALAPLTAFAHPVIYKDGWALSSSNMESYSNNYAVYSFSNRWAAGLDQWRFTKDKQDTDMVFAKMNHLLWRKNGHDYQANIYLHGGLGLADQRSSKGAWQGGIEGDWETRTLYTSLKHYEFHSSGLLDSSMTQARVGLSPVIADFKSLQTWVMLQAMYTPDVNRTVMLTPMLRFFYENVLWEVGSSTKGDWMLNLMVHL